MKSISRNSIYNIIYSILNVLFPFLTSMYVARILLPAGVGNVSFAQNIVSYFVPLASLGIPVYGIREISKVRFDKEEKNKVFTELFIINCVSTIFSISLYLLLIYIIPSLKEDKFLYFACGTQIIFNFANLDWLFKGEEEYSYITIRSIIIKAISFLAVVFFVKCSSDYIIYALLSSLALSGNYIFNLFHFKKFISISFKNLNFRRHFKSIFILTFTIFLSTVYSKIDITMLGIMISDEATGLYTYAHNVINVMITFCISISAVFLPRLSLFYQSNREKFYELLSMGFKILTFLAIPLSVATFMLSNQIVEILFGESFKAASLTLKIFVPLIIIKSYGDLFCYQLVIATSNESKRLPAYILAAVLNVILNFIFIPIWAQNGAAIASVIAELVVNGVQLILLRKVINIKVSFNCIVQAIIGSIIMGIFIYFFNSLVTFNIYFKMVLVVLIGFIIYIIANLIMRNELLFSGINKIKNQISNFNNKRRNY